MRTIKEFYDNRGEFLNFSILDSNLANPDPILVNYEPGSEHIGVYEMHQTQEISFKKETEIPQWPIDQWRRVIFCQGLSSVLGSKKLYTKRPFSYLRYLIVEGDEDPIEKTVKLHLGCSRRLGSKLVNPYRDKNNGFHITFFEKIESLSEYEGWKTGVLYEKAAGSESSKKNFRQSAFTMFTTSEDLKNVPKSSSDAQQQELEPCWTILLLTPSDFFENPQRVLVESDLGWKEVGKHRCRLTAELTSIFHALRVVVNRWENLYQHIEGLLHKDFMDPKAYVNLLFDDENFSESRLYFWIIGCLNEFDISIEDNIKQWMLFREARVDPHLEKDQGDNTPGEGNMDSLEQSQNLTKEIDNLQEALKNWQKQFKHQKETAIALRDGLFNASALMESRASTRLGQNVKLLTYVSIFYLPLAFCAALWAIPNITDSGTRNPFITTSIIVGFVTYMIVFNLGNIANHCTRLYEPYRTSVIKHMGSDNTTKSKWEKLTKKFESSFGPKRSDGEPSEWWILIYSIRLVPKWLSAFFKKCFQQILIRDSLKPPEEVENQATV
ncbi:hypothetical protein ACHAPF_011254 [Botrytis cinerea]